MLRFKLWLRIVKTGMHFWIHSWEAWKDSQHRKLAQTVTILVQAIIQKMLAGVKSNQAVDFTLGNNGCVHHKGKKAEGNVSGFS